jgi:hypothetical protein
MIVLLVVLLAGCYWLVDDTYDPQFDIPATGATTPSEVCLWVDARVTYTSDAIQHEYWQSPDQTYEWGCGDCEDYVILVIYLIHRDLGGWPRLAKGMCYGGIHGWVEYEGRWYEAQTGIDVTGASGYVLGSYIPYGEMMWRSMNIHKTIAK